LSGRAQSRPLIISVLSANEKHPFSIDQFTSLSEIKNTIFSIDINTTYLIVCQKGIASYEATKIIKEKYPTAKILSLVGGIQNY